MRSRIALVITLIFATVGGMSVLSDMGLAETAQTYTWENCAEGWTVSNGGSPPNSLPGTAAWTRRAPGDESGFSYNTGEYTDNQALLLTSPVYKWKGGPIDISYSIAYSTEPKDGDILTDYVTFDWRVGTGAWTTAAEYIDENEGFPDFIKETQTIDAPAGDLQVRFYFTSDFILSSPTGDYKGIFVDNVLIPLPKPDGTACTGASPSASGSGSPKPTASPSPSPTGGGGSKCTITGTRFGDRIEGTAGDDVICGKGGDDTIDGLGGNDVLKGNGGDDTLLGSGGSDTLKGAGGNDTLRGGGDRDTLRGGKGNDDLNGGGGKDNCKGGKGKDRIKRCE